MKLRALTMLGLLLAASQSWAVTISLTPSAQTAMPGDTVFLDLTVSGLGSGGAPSLGAFDIDILFDDTAISLVGATFGSSLGDLGLGETVQGSFLSGGTLDIFEVSLLSSAALDALQSDSFLLASLEFAIDVLPLGSSTALGLGTVLLADGPGNQLTDFDVNGATISNPVVGVPEPGSIMLWALGLLALSVGLGRARLV